MILKNKNTKDVLEISYPEFRKKFAKKIQAAFESFKQTELSKTSYGFKDDNSVEFNFYVQIQYNFNSFGNSAWYVDKM